MKKELKEKYGELYIDLLYEIRKETLIAMYCKLNEKLDSLEAELDEYKKSELSQKKNH